MSQMRKKHSKVLKKKPFQINTEDDASLLDLANLQWKGLEELRNNLSVEAGKITNFIALAESKKAEVEQYAPEQLTTYNNAVMALLNDTNTFIKSLDSISRQHEGKSGKITTMDDYGTYQNLGMKYTTSVSEYTDLVGLNMASLEAVFNNVDAKKDSLNGKD